MADSLSDRYAELLTVKKLRGKKIVRRIGQTRKYESLPKGLRAMAALLVIRNKAIKPLLAAARDPATIAGSSESRTARYTLRHDSYRHARRFPGAGAGRVNIDNYFVGLRP
jgi:hypothetical protein